MRACYYSTMAGNKKTIVLLDAHAIIHRAYHALPDFTAPDGRPTGALYGLTSMLLGIIEQFNPYAVLACFDLPGKTFRHEAYADYKGARKEIEEELIAQLISARALLERMNVPIYDAEGFEADDVLGTLASQIKKKSEFEIVIASGDMDTLQLVDNDKVKVFTLRRGIKDTVVYNEKAVIDKFGFSPELLPDYKGLRGDVSDNIKGVKGIGEKTATTLIENFGTLENLYKHLNKEEKAFLDVGIKPRIIGLLKENEEDAFFSKTLATIRLDAPVRFIEPVNDWRKSLDGGVMVDYLQSLGFRTIINRVRKVFGIENDLKKDENKSLSKLELRKIAIGVWLLNSDITNPTEDDILNHTNAEDLVGAREYVLKELKDKGLLQVYEKIELPLIPILDRMQEKGFKIDKKHFAKIGKKYHTLLTEVEKEIFNMAGHEFNVRSPKQVGEVIFDEMDLSVSGLRKTAGGARSTRESELYKMINVHPIIQKILDYRELHKVLSTYVDTLPKLADKDSVLHSELLQAGSSTGRFASRNPNLQNIPVRNTMGKEIRQGFVARNGFVLVGLDYSQIELRVAAILSKDPVMTKTFVRGEDIHTTVASEVFKVSAKDVDPEMRRKAKIINFGILYGMGVRALKENLNSDMKEAQDFYDAYKGAFPTLFEFMEDVKRDAYSKGYTETLFGRRRYFPNLHAQLPHIRALNERAAINAPIQGTATADIIKLALIHVDNFIQSKKLSNKVYPLMQIHDEILMEIEEKLADGIIPGLIKVMESVLYESFLKYKTEIPLVVNASVGRDWGELKD